MTQRGAWGFACSLGFTPLQHMAYATGRLQACRRRGTVFLHRQYLDLPFLAYQGAWAAGGATDFFALSAWVDTTSGGGTTLDIAPGLRLVNGKPAQVIVTPGTVDPTTPRPAGRVPPAAASALKVSLAEAARRLSQRLAAEGAGGDAPGLRAVQVAPGLAPKAVCVAGEDNAPPGALLPALAEAYGLEVTRERDTATLGQPRPRVLDDPAAVGAEVRRLLPAPYVRAVTAPAPPAPVNGETAGGPGPGGSGPPPGGYSPDRADALFVAAVRRLRELVEPQLARRTDGRLPVPEAGAQARSLVALSGWLKCVPELPALSEGAGTYLSHFGQATLTLSAGGGGAPGRPPRTPNPNAVDFKIQYQGSDGKGAGVAGRVTFPPGTLG